MQKNVSISTTEGEYVSISDISCAILFIWHILQDMNVKIKLPIVVYVDNAGAIFLANNKAIGQRTKHIDIRYHFVREYVEDGILKIVYIKTKDNDSDILTKNTNAKTFWRHVKEFMNNDEVQSYK